MNPLNWFDAHLDLAYCAVNGRDMLASPDTCGGPDLPASITLPSLREGRVTHALATVFTEAGGQSHDRAAFAAGDAHAANRAGVLQIETYQRWFKEGLARKLADERTDQLRLGILIECADPITEPDDLEWWVERGVVAIAMAWGVQGRYAGGNTTQGGLTDLGVQLAREMDRMGVVHDASHLSDLAFEDLLDTSDGLVIASHSNCRELLGGGTFGENQRHLSDEQIGAIIERGGVIGLNLFSAFLDRTLRDSGRGTLEMCVHHIEHVCEIAGDKTHVGLGSDADGGFSRERLPGGIDRPKDFVKLAEALRSRGWNDQDIAGFALGNFASVFGV